MIIVERDWNDRKIGINDMHEVIQTNTQSFNQKKPPPVSIAPIMKSLSYYLMPKASVSHTFD